MEDCPNGAGSRHGQSAATIQGPGSTQCHWVRPCCRLLSVVASARFARNAGRTSTGGVGCVGPAWSGLLLHHDEEDEERAGRRHARKAFAIACLANMESARGLAECTSE